MHRCVPTLFFLHALFGCTPPLEEVLDDPLPQTEDTAVVQDLPLPEVVPVDIERLEAHLQALHDLGMENGGTRAVGTVGFQASVDYVTESLEDMGYAAEQQPFEVTIYVDSDPPIFDIVSPTPSSFTPNEDISTMLYSASGDVTGDLYAVDLVMPPGPYENSSTSGCEVADFSTFPVGGIALMQRGSCSFSQKVTLAENAGAVGAIIFNEGQPGRTELLEASLSEDVPTSIPVLSASFEAGEALVSFMNTDTLFVHMVVDSSMEEVTAYNVVTTYSGLSPERLFLGAHLDSVPDGPGVNDNGSGTATLLEIAYQLSLLETPLDYSVSFGFWGAEELGLLGSLYHVGELNQDERDTIIGNLNFDMVASPNPVRFIYDGNASNSHGENLPPEGSPAIEFAFQDYFDARSLSHAPTDLDGRSDYVAFLLAGIPAGGLFTGAEGEMSVEEASQHGGLAGQPYDSCYHQFCDQIDNVNLEVFEEMVNAASYATLRLTTADTPLGAIAQARPLHVNLPSKVHTQCHRAPTVE